MDKMSLNNLLNARQRNIIQHVSPQHIMKGAEMITTFKVGDFKTVIDTINHNPDTCFSLSDVNDMIEFWEGRYTYVQTFSPYPFYSS